MHKCDEQAEKLLKSLRYHSSRPGVGGRGLMDHHVKAFIPAVAAALREAERAAPALLKVMEGLVNVIHAHNRLDGDKCGWNFTHIIEEARAAIYLAKQPDAYLQCGHRVEDSCECEEL